MNRAIIHFSDKSTLELKEGDTLIPIVSNKSVDEVTASMAKPIKLWNHISNGLIPSMMDVFIKCEFFYLNQNYDVVYNSNAIVRIELI